VTPPIVALVVGVAAVVFDPAPSATLLATLTVAFDPTATPCVAVG